LIWIKWLTGAVALSLLAVVASIAWIGWEISEVADAGTETISFEDQASALLQQGQEEEVLALAAARAKEFPKDAYVYWYRARAYYQLNRFKEAIDSFSTAEELAPSWRAEYTRPYMESAKLRLVRSGGGSALTSDSAPRKKETLPR
jgi:cytochrome c-type biogenesis protein CcmH/NrfG